MAEWKTPTAVHSCSGYYSPTYACTKCIDGITATGSWYDHDNHTSWIILDLGETLLVEQIRIYLRSASSMNWTNFDVYVSDDPENWGAAVAEGLSLTPSPGAWRVKDVTDKAGRYIKLDDILSSVPGEPWRIECAEFQAETSLLATASAYSYIM